MHKGHVNTGVGQLWLSSTSDILWKDIFLRKQLVMHSQLTHHNSLAHTVCVCVRARV